MEVLTALVNTVVGLPVLIANLLIWFAYYLRNPYVAVLQTCRLLWEHHIATVVLLVSAFSLFVLSLGIPDTRELILTFDGGMTTSLRRLYEIDTKGREFLYLALFVLSATVFATIVGIVIREALRLRQAAKDVFLDIFNVYVAFTVGWFIIIAIILAKVSNRDTFREISQTLKINKMFEAMQLTDVSDIFISPAFVIILGMSIYFGYRFLQRWGLRRNFVDLLRKDAHGAFSQTSMIAFPVLVAILMIVVPAVLLAALSNALFARAESEAHYLYQATCIKSSRQLHTNIVIKNNMGQNAMIGPLFVGLWRNRPPKGGKRPEADQVIRLDPANLLWASRRGLFLEVGEIRYFRLLSAFSVNLIDLSFCAIINDGRGNEPCKEGSQPNRCIPYAYITPTSVEGDTMSSVTGRSDSR